ncbi:MAG: hypothetical protein ABGX04_10810, partial [Myxococcales bacterium]
GALVYAAASGNLTGEQYARLKSELEDSYQGARNAGRPLLLEGVGSEGRPELGRDRDIDFAQLDRNWGKLEEEPAPIVAFREGSLRLIHDTAEPDHDLLFDVAADPGEHVNLRTRQPADADRLLKEAKAHLNSKTVFEGGAPQVELDEMHLRQLRALGYSIE